MPVDGDDKTEDFYIKLLETIDAGEHDCAVEMVIGLQDRWQRLGTLATLARTLTRSLDNALDRALDLDLDNALARTRALGLTRVLARALARALDRAHDLDLARARAFAHALALDLDLARALALDLALDRLRVVITVLDILMGDKMLAASEPPLATGENLSGIDFLTPQNLANQVAPYLQALIDLQRIITQMKDEPFPQPRILNITEGSVGFEMSGVAEAINAVRDMVVPWRHEHAKMRSDLEVEKLEGDAKKALVFSIIDKIAPHLSEQERLTYFTQLLNPLTVVTESPLELLPREGEED